MKRSCYVPVLLLLAAGLALVSTPLWARDPGCNIASLTLDVENLPPGWESPWVVVPPALETLGAKDGDGRYMENGQSTASHTVSQYSGSWLAVFHLWFERETFFPSVGWDWSDLERIEFRRIFADEYRVQCGESNMQHLDTRCTAILRYGPYISDFTSNIREGAMSVDDFEEIVLKIDGMFRSCIQPHADD